MKKILCLLLAVAMCAGVLGACAPANNTATPTPPPANNSTPAPETSAPQEETPAAPTPVTIQFYTWEASLKEQNEAVIAAFQDKYPHITVNINYPVENDNVEYTKKIDLLLLANEQIDCMMESSVAKMTGKVDRELYQPLDSFFASEGTKYDDIYSVSSNINGNYYGLPIDVSPWFVMINKKMLDAAGLPIPSLDWTWDDYREYAAKMTSGSGQDKVYGSYFHNWNNYFQMGMYSTKMDNCYYNADGSLAFEDPNYRDWMQFRYDMENTDKSSTPLIDVKTSKLAYRDMFFGEKAAMIPTGAWMLAEIKDLEKRPHDFQTVFAPLPKWGNGVAGRTFSDTKMLSIPVSAKYPQEAYEFIRFYTTEGAFIRAGGLVALKNADIKSNINTIIEGGDTEALYNTASLYAIFENPKLEYNAPLTAPVYDAEIGTMFGEVCEMYMVGGIPLDQCISDLMTRGNDIIKKS